jgi:uncharacterized membrane protein YtjA (UPF0391 family)
VGLLCRVTCASRRGLLAPGLGAVKAQPLQFAPHRSGKTNELEAVMLYWAAVFFIIALVAGILGFFGIAAAATGVAKILFFAFIVLAVVSLIVGRRAPS